LAHNTLSNISGSVLNATYSSLSSAQPLASSYSFDPLALIAETQPTSTQIVTATNSTGHANDNSTSDSLSGGAIAGIVIGVVAAIAIAGIATFLLWRRRQKKRNRPAQAMTPADPKYAKPAQEHRGHSGHIPREMEPETNQATELPGNQQCYPPQELATNP
jgi:beta-lactamase regulating signal transducer with metallopeptidase domain